MAKRIYSESVKKWAIVSGISGGTIVGLIFYFLLTAGAITDFTYSGDMVCAGTEEDPCYAYINFTAKEDIFIYPIEYDPWGRDTPFEFEPNLKSWKLQRTWGDGWRTVNLSDTWSSKVKYSIRFAKGKSYQIRIVGYKNNPKETIKWSAFDVIDPNWIGADCQPDTGTCSAECEPIFINGDVGDGFAFVTDECYDEDEWMENTFAVKNDTDSACDTNLGAGDGQCAYRSNMMTMGEYYCPSYERNGNSAVAFGDCYCNEMGEPVECTSNMINAEINLTHEFFSEGRGGGTISPVVSLTLVTPEGNYDATQYEFFEVTVNVTCLYANCSEINISLDPR